MQNFYRRGATAVGVLSALTIALFCQQASQRAEWNQPFKPFRIVGNIYYVGPAGVSSFFISTPQGAILIDGGLPESAPLIEKNIADLGFHMIDVKYLLNGHAHFDHAGGLAELKRLSGGKMVASKPDAEALTTGRGADSHPVKVDRLIGDKDTVSLGGATLTAHITPGHTRGCTTWTMPVTEAGKTYNVVFYCSTSVVDVLVNNHSYPQIVADYEHSFVELRKLPCDVFLAPHGSLFHLSEKRARMTPGAPNPFIDAQEYQPYIDASEREFRHALKQQQAPAAKQSSGTR
jgi:metallo-beta-lactamase class B